MHSDVEVAVVTGETQEYRLLVNPLVYILAKLK